MNFNVDLRLTALRCVQPDESEEEPYLWTFFFQLDGSTVKQLQPNVFRLLGNVKIAAGDGGHANLSSSTAISGQILQIPDGVGAHQATLRPIRLQIIPGQTIVIPGRLLAFCVLMEEDATSDGSILKAHAALRDFLELQWNDFISNQLNQTAVTAEMSNVQQGNPSLSGRPLILAAVQSLIDKFVDGLEAQATQVVENTVIFAAVEDSDILELVFNAIDHDDPMGTMKLGFDERQIIGASFQIPIHIPIIRTKDGRWTAYHELYGNLHATLTAGSNDLVVQTARGAPARLDGGEHFFNVPFLCIPPGTRVEWTLNASNLEEDIRFTYPFLDVRWSVENIVLAGPSGTVQFSAGCAFPKFDPSQPPRLSTSQHAQKQVKVHYEIQDQGDDGRLLKLWNDPQDGNYSFIASAVGLAGNGVEIQLGSTMVTFAGQTIDLEPPEFVSAYNKCLDEFEKRYSKSKKIGFKDLWDPHSRFKAYEEMIQVVDNLAAVRGLREAQISILKEGIARKLHVKVKQPA